VESIDYDDHLLARACLDTSYLIDYLELIARIDQRLPVPRDGSRESMRECLDGMVEYHASLVCLMESLDAVYQRLSPIVDRLIDESPKERITKDAADGILWLETLENRQKRFVILDTDAISSRLEWLSNDAIRSLAFRLRTVAEDLDQFFDTPTSAIAS
jgi:hypothetical protein